MKSDYSGDLAPYKDKHREKKAESMRLFKRYIEKAKTAGKLNTQADPELLTQCISCFMKGTFLNIWITRKALILKTKRLN